MVALIGFCFFAQVVSAETAEEWDEKGIGFGMSGEYGRAIEDYNKAIELDPNLATNVPGFEAVFTIAGLLALTYLLRRRK